MADAIINGINTNYLPSSFVQNGTIVDQQKAAEVAGGVQAKLENMPPAEQALFLAAIHSSVDLSPDTVSKMDSGQIDAAIDRLSAAFGGDAGAAGGAGGVANAMDWLFSGGVSEIATLGKLLIQQAASEAKSALDDRLAAREAAKNDLMAQAGKLRDEANTMISGAVAALVTTVVTAALSCLTASLQGLSLKGMASEMKAMKGNAGKLEKATQEVDKELEELGKARKDFKLNKSPGKDEQDIEAKFDAKEKLLLDRKNDQSKGIEAEQTGLQKKFDHFNQQGQLAGTFGQTINTLGGGVSQFINTMATAEGKRDEAEGSVDAANAQYQQSEADKAKDVQTAFEDTITKLISFLKDMRDSMADRMQSFTKV